MPNSTSLVFSGIYTNSDENVQLINSLVVEFLQVAHYR